MIITCNLCNVGLNIHKGKSKILRYNTSCNNPITIDREDFEDVKTFTYLGSITAEHGGSDADVEAWIGKAKAAYLQLKNIWNSKQLSVNQHQVQDFQYKCQNSSTKWDGNLENYESQPSSRRYRCHNIHLNQFNNWEHVLYYDDDIKGVNNSTITTTTDEEEEEEEEEEIQEKKDNDVNFIQRLGIELQKRIGLLPKVEIVSFILRNISKKLIRLLCVKPKSYTEISRTIRAARTMKLIIRAYSHLSSSSSSLSSYNLYDTNNTVFIDLSDLSDSPRIEFINKKCPINGNELNGLK
ncbi:unnamed protein product [Schistosoma margrebowiei]|uniref:Uncharacterized protein n=1 Tax=Schistosoma margrebowiei TaxID=48269 RepID=A0A3P8BZQ8_9TREM|nr:unnamed protein product [Schistosoma margrebowiei]